MAHRLSRVPLLALLFALFVIGLLIWWFDAFRGPNRSPSDISTAEMNSAIQAVAAAENGKYDQAIALWEELLIRFPGDPELLLNQAVTVLKWIDETSGRLSSGLVSDPTAQAKLREELAAAMDTAEATIAEVAKLPSSDGRTAFLQAAFLEAKSRQLQYPEDQTLRNQAAQVLVDALSKNPAQPLLACKLDDLAQELAGDNAEIEKHNTDALFASWKADPRNLYLLVRAGDALMKHQDPRLAELLGPSLEVAKPMRSMLQAALVRTNPEELIAKATQAITAGDWRQVQQLRLWFNVLKGTSGFRPDTRLVKPDIMALLNVSFLERFSDKLSAATPAPAIDPARIEYTRQDIGPADAVGWYDYDLDLDMDVVVVQGNELRLYGTSPESGLATDLKQQLTLPIAPTGMLPIDLFDVDSPNRPRLPVTVAELMDTGTPGEPSDSNSPRPGTTERGVDSNSPRSSTLGRGVGGEGHDTIQELVLWSDEGVVVVTSTPVDVADPATNESPGRQLSVLDDVPGLSGPESIVQIEPCDIDGDGDLDLIVAGKSQLRILQNNGNRTFVDVSEFSSLPDTDFRFSRLFACDVDRDLDQDLLVASRDQPGIFILENILHSQFRFRNLKGDAWKNLETESATASLTDIVCCDLDGNASWDIFATGASGAFCALTRTVAPGAWTGTGLVKTSAGPTPGNCLAVVDLNNDAALDLLVGRDAGLEAWLGTPGGTFSDLSYSLAAGNFSALAALDANGDGAIELLTVRDQRGMLFIPKQLHVGGFVSARIHGINDINGGGRINHYAVGSTLELRSPGQLQARVIRDPSTHFGIGDTQPTNLRIVFNNGLTQNVEDVQPNTVIEERQELKGSCPFVYGWNGERFELITDLLWNAPLGLQVARGQVLPDRRWEYLLLPGELMQPRDGSYELRVTEELWEVAYFDHLTLTAIDHPADVEVFTNEKVGPPAIAEPKLITAKERLFPRSAVDSHGRDCLAKLARIDRDFVQAFDVQICQGLCEPHFIELDFGTLASDQPWLMYLNGWMHPADTSLNIGMAQNPERPSPEPPSLWVVDEAGKWICAQPFMGFPGGKPKSIVVDLAGVFCSNDHRLRIASSQQLYWDQAFVACDSDVTACRETALALQSAELHYRGFGQLLPRASDQPHWYDYQTVSRAPKWPELSGPFTRCGDIRELLHADDDRLVVMVSGDEFVVRFAMPEQPLPAGWRRDFILHSTGWDKDADLNTLSGDGSLPLPFRAMETYPPPAHQQPQVDAVQQLNAPHLTRMREARG